MRTLNLGILAHVDAGKTTLTERLLYLGGAIDRIGSVDQGHDPDRQPRARARARHHDQDGRRLVRPGRPDGQPDRHARPPRLHRGGRARPRRARRRDPRRLRGRGRAAADAAADAGAPADARADAHLREQDRPGRRERGPNARGDPATAHARRRADGRRRGPGDRAATLLPGRWDDPAFAGAVAETLAERDEELLAAYVDSAGAAGRAGSRGARPAHARGSDPSGLRRLGRDRRRRSRRSSPEPPSCSPRRPAAATAARRPLAARTFKVERPPSGERVAYVRVFAGSLHARDQVRYGDGREGRVTALRVVAPGGPVQRPLVRRGEIAKVSGLADIRVGDAARRRARRPARRASSRRRRSSPS